MISVVQYYPFKYMYGAACIIDSFADKRYAEFLELVNAKDPEHYSIVIPFWGKDWRQFFDVCHECRKALNCVCE